MKEVNALKLRNNLGEILDQLNNEGEPIFISKGRKIRAVLVTPQQFEQRFLDWMIEERKTSLLESIKALKRGRRENTDSLTVLRQLRGY
ncbi:MAG TPA: type II toxin-antitoxin system Phd/YefM family antitoxin [Acidobacteriota bacterium]|nr:type II toxin-antitoxin system Phd/YefM family antitoxin [Acidobacteriota bacterium]